MKLITLRGIPKEVAVFIEREARKEGSSLNKAVIHLLEKSMGVGKKEGKLLYHDLDGLSGSWSKQEAEMFDKAFKLQRAIDFDLWK